MTLRLVAITGWLAAGHAAVFALFWALLQVPESNAAMLGLSGVIVVLDMALAAWVEGVALAAWRADCPVSALPARALRWLPAIATGVMVFGLVWWLIGRAGGWWFDHRGETDAWLMLRFGWTRTAPLHTAAGWVVAFLRYGVGLSLVLAVVSTIERAGFAGLPGARWIRDAFSPRQLIALTALLLLFFWLPGRVVSWRPASLAPDWQEVAFVAIKLGLFYLTANVGWALGLGMAARRAAKPDRSLKSTSREAESASS